MKKTTWRPVQSLPGCDASTEGEVRHDGQLLRQYQHNRRGYLCIVVRGQRYLVHRLILEAFAGPAPLGHNDAMHVNGNPCDNRPANLEWGSHAQNMAMLCGDPRLSHRDEANPNRRLTRAAVEAIRAAYRARTGFHWGRKGLAEIYRISETHALRIAQGAPGGWS